MINEVCNSINYNRGIEVYSMRWRMDSNSKISSGDLDFHFQITSFSQMDIHISIQMYIWIQLKTASCFKMCCKIESNSK